MSRFSGLILLTTLFAAGCGHDPRLRNDTAYLGGFRPQAQPQRANFDNVSYWDGDGVSGAPRIRISLGEQRAYFYRGGELVGISVISSGREGFGTTTGTFKITQKDRDHKSNLYGDYVDAQTGAVVKKDIDIKKDPRHPGPFLTARRCHFSCASPAASACTKASCQAMPPPTAASACRASWPSAILPTWKRARQWK